MRHQQLSVAGEHVLESRSTVVDYASTATELIVGSCKAVHDQLGVGYERLAVFGGSPGAGGASRAA